MKINTIVKNAIFCTILTTYSQAEVIKVIDNNYKINSIYQLVKASNEEKSNYGNSIGLSYNQLKDRFEANTSQACQKYDSSRDKCINTEITIVDFIYDYNCQTKIMHKSCPKDTMANADIRGCIKRKISYTTPKCDLDMYYGNNGLCYSEQAMFCKNNGVSWDGTDTCFKKIELFSLKQINN